MIYKAEEFRIAASIRQRIIDMLAGIENATWDRFNDKSPNWLTRSHLNSLTEDYKNGLVSLGAVPVIAHAPCGQPDHEKLAVWKLGRSTGYWRFVLEDGRSDFDLLVGDQLVIGDQTMESDFDSMVREQMLSHEPCACNPGKRAKEHATSRFYVWPRNHQSAVPALARLVFYLHDAMALSEDRRPRSAIREKLLQALIELERLLVPVSAEEEIAKRKTQ